MQARWATPGCTGGTMIELDVLLENSSRAVTMKGIHDLSVGIRTDKAEILGHKKSLIVNCD
jgi:hypothetical protein